MRRSIHEENQLLIKKQYIQPIQCYAEFFDFMLLVLFLQNIFQ